MRTWIPPLYFLQARCPSCHPTYSVKALKALSLLFEYFTFDNFHLFLPMFFVCVCVQAEDRQREFSMGVTSISDSFGITVAAAVAIPVHNYLCTLPN